MMRRPAAAGVMRRATAVVWGRRALSTEARAAANRTAFERLTAADPVLVGLGPALELLPGMEPSTILTSGPPQPFAAFVGGQRDAIIGAALFEGLAPDREEASTKLHSGEIPVAGCHDHVRAPVSVLTSQLPLTRCLRQGCGGVAGWSVHGVDARVRGGGPRDGDQGLLQLLRGHQPAPAQLRRVYGSLSLLRPE